MEHITMKLPDKICSCIHERYPGYSLICTKEDTDSKGHVFYIIDLLHGDNYCHLKISDTGILIDEEVEPRFNNDYSEQYY